MIVEMVGSLIRDTGSAYAPDMDLQVRRRPGSDRADALFTETDKCKVAQNLEKLRCVKLPVTIGNVAITFTMHGSPVDLVLANPRSEDFPKLRGGENFYENSAQINRFLDQMPLARAVILGIKQFFSDGRPKGILLDAIVWRLSTTYRGRLSTALRDDDFSKDFNSFLIMSCLHSRIGRSHHLEVISRKIWTNYQRGNGTNTFRVSRGFGRFQLWI